MDSQVFYNVALVDDERDVCARLSKMLLDLDMPINIIKTYENGFDAYEDLQSKKIDILITDIRIPYIDGLELARRVRSEINPLCKFIIISGYDEFDYAKQAIDLEVIGYLCKPINQNELATVLKKALQKISDDSNNLNIKEKLIDTSKKYELNILEGDFRRLLEYNSKTSEIIEKIKESGIDLTNIKIQIALFEFDLPYNYKKMDTVYIFLQDRLLDILQENYFLLQRDGHFVLFDYRTLENGVAHLYDILQRLIKSVQQVFDVYISVAICNAIESTDSFRNAYLQCKRNLDLRQGTSMVLTVHEDNKTQSDFIDSKFFKQLSYLVKFKEKKEIMTYLRSGILEASKKSHLAFSLFITETLNTIILSSNFELKDNTNLMLNADIYEAITSLKNIDRTIDYLEKVVDSVKEINIKSLVGIQESNYESLISYIECHYADVDLSLETLGNSVALSPSYIAYLLKNYKNTTFVKLITELRIEEAKILLLSRNYKISEVSLKVGYQDPYYFSYCFKKYCGVSPKQFANQ
jgi:two-component system response regulator YesN